MLTFNCAKGYQGARSGAMRCKLCYSIYMDTLEEKIFNILDQGDSVLLVGPTEAGKTWFVKNKLIPLCAANPKTFEYIDGYPDDHQLKDTDLVIVDEFETFLDRAFLESRHEDEVPYYTDKYVADNVDWYRRLAEIKKPMLFVLTRNEQEEIDYMVNSMKKTDWSQPVSVFEYKDVRN